MCVFAASGLTKYLHLGTNNMLGTFGAVSLQREPVKVTDKQDVRWGKKEINGLSALPLQMQNYVGTNVLSELTAMTKLIQTPNVCVSRKVLLPGAVFVKQMEW